jgi:hypothetical protein
MNLNQNYMKNNENIQNTSIKQIHCKINHSKHL